MMDNAKKARERFEFHAVRVAEHLGIASVERFDELQPQVQTFFEKMGYNKIIEILVVEDRKKNQSLAMLSMKYLLPIRTIRRILSG